MTMNHIIILLLIAFDICCIWLAVKALLAEKMGQLEAALFAFTFIAIGIGLTFTMVSYMNAEPIPPMPAVSYGTWGQK